MSLKPSVPSVPEDFDEYCQNSSGFYVGPETKLGDLTLDASSAKSGLSLEDMVCDAASDAARTLQDLHNHDISGSITPTATTGRKRSRAISVDNSLHENVREILIRQYETAEPSSPHAPARLRGMASDPYLQMPTHTSFGRTAKRACCSTEAASGYHAAGVHATMSFRGRGMWDSILN